MPGGAYGDSMGGMTIAGGIAAALFARDRTGETSVIDVSLMSVGTWAMALSVTSALVMGAPFPPFPLTAPMTIPVNPLLGSLRTSDGRWINFTMLQPGRYFADVCRHRDRAPGPGLPRDASHPCRIRMTTSASARPRA